MLPEIWISLDGGASWVQGEFPHLLTGTMAMFK